MDQLTIQAGIDAAEDGDTVLVADGLYFGEGNRDISFNGKAIIVKSENGPEATTINIQQRGRGFIFDQKETNDSVLDGFTIQGAKPLGASDMGGGISCLKSSPIIRNCIIIQNEANSGGGISCVSRASPTVIHCVVMENNAHWNGGGIFTDLYSSPTFANCVITQNSADRGGGISCKGAGSPTIENCIIMQNSAQDGSGIHCVGSATFINCVVVENKGSGGGFAIDGSDSQTTIMNTIVWGNTKRQIHNQSNATLVVYCDVQGGFDGVANIDLEPMFVNEENGDYRLKPESPCIDTGNPSPIYNDVDGSRNDMGAYGGPEGDSEFVESDVPGDGIQPFGIFLAEVELTQGPNIFALPLQPEIPITASQLANDLQATVVLRAVEGKFQAYIPPDDIFADGFGFDFELEGGKGVIVNLLAPITYPVFGTPWGIPILVEDEVIVVPAAPSKPSGTWAFVFAGHIDGFGYDNNVMSFRESPPRARVTNHRNAASHVVPVSPSGKFMASFVDMAQQDVVEVGDNITVQLVDSNGFELTESKQHILLPEHVANAYLLPRISGTPEKNQLLQNYPNPFNPETWIPFVLSEAADVKILIYDMSGHHVQTLQLGQREPGTYHSKAKAAYWDGKNEAGEMVSSGVYFYKLRIGAENYVRKAILLK